MPKLKFTARGIDAIKAPTDKPQEDYWDVDPVGFGLRVSRDGRKTWFVKYRLGGRRPRVTLGTYPVMSLALAREEAYCVLLKAKQGVDTAQKKKEERQGETFRDLATIYLNQHAKLNKKSWDEDERILNHDVLSNWGHLKATDIRRSDVIVLLDKIVARPAPILANRVLALVRKIFNFGIERGMIENNPCQAVKRPTKENPRDRVLNVNEIQALWMALEQLTSDMKRLFQLTILTGQRGLEVRSMRKDEIDLSTRWWTNSRGEDQKQNESPGSAK